jgi:hypothetical protein
MPGLNLLITTSWRRTSERRHHSTILNLENRWGWVIGFTPLRLYPQGNSPVHGVQEAGWALKPAWTLWTTEKSLALTGNLTSTSRLFGAEPSRYIDSTCPIVSLHMPAQRNGKIHRSTVCPENLLFACIVVEKTESMCFCYTASRVVSFFLDVTCIREFSIAVYISRGSATDQLCETWSASF